MTRRKEQSSGNRKGIESSFSRFVPEHITLLVFGLALAVRLLFLVDSADAPTFHVLLVDARDYHKLATQLLAGVPGTDLDLFWQPPLYPVLLAALYGLFGPNLLAVKLVQAVVGALVVVGAMRFAARHFSRRNAAVTGLILTFYSPLIYFGAEHLATIWAALAAVILVDLCSRLRKSQSAKKSFGLGTVCGLAAQIRPLFVPFFVCYWVWCLRSAESRRAACWNLTGLSFSLGVVGIFAALWAGAFTPLPISGGLNLYIGNNPNTCATINARPSSQQWLEVGEIALRHGHVPKRPGSGYVEEVADFARSQPLAFLKNLVTKTFAMFSSRELPRNHDIYTFREWSVLLRLTLWKIGGFGFPFGVLFPLCVIALTRWRSIPSSASIFLVTWTLSVIAVFTSSRYRTPMIPVLAPLAAEGIFKLGEIVASRRWKTLSLCALAIGVVVVLQTLPGPFCQERIDYRAELQINLGRALAETRPRVAKQLFKQAAVRAPDDDRPVFFLALLYHDQGQYAEAERLAKYSLQKWPKCVRCWDFLATLYARTNRPGEALRVCRRALLLTPSSYRLHRKCGWILAVGKGQLDSAIEHLRKALEYAPGDVATRIALYRLLKAVGNDREATLHYDEAFRLAPPVARRSLTQYPPLRRKEDPKQGVTRQPSDMNVFPQ